ncbi:MAG: hypothetical protein KC503_22120 [Myxococcales bacterium]|nr:hypothetical protein [Myxococcales bacterium]
MRAVVGALAVAALALSSACKHEGAAQAPGPGAAATKRTAAPTRKPQSSPAEPPKPSYRISAHESAAAALRAVLAAHPDVRVLGFGEYHQKKGAAKVTSAIKRFTSALLPLVNARASDLIVETWVSTGACGKTEQRVAKVVRKTTKRPVTTENEVVTLIKRADKLHVRPHILKMTCKDYEHVRPKGKVDFARFLKLTGDQLLAKIVAVRKDRDALRAKLANAKGNKAARMRAILARKQLVLVYGGALHNDRAPSKEFAAYAYGPRASKAAGEGRYVEVDLFVPEYIEEKGSLVSEEGWFAEFRRRASAQQALLIRRGPGSYAIVFRRSAKKVAPKTGKP